MNEKVEFLVGKGFKDKYPNKWVFDSSPCIAISHSKELSYNSRANVFSEYHWEEICSYFGFSIKKSINKCSCERQLLVNCGCKCGSFARELEDEQFN